ncbi:M23 family metallopeptidase [Virgibacillus ndiopensis]|uniref:M23 family metallopeptidase n=1 Tax=Virgibacillus ndiopensis TaxID=2004408 RepID=UPI000C0855DB|nr:M23 family metallopeptidase [Virgibacillus ndiopensis]
MNKGVKQVRKSINQRKNLRGLKTKDMSKSITPAFPQEEEKHGFFPFIPDNQQPQQTKEKSRFISWIILKGILSVVLFFGVAILFQTNSELLRKPTEWTSNALTQEFPFARVNQWYQETFGSPLAFTPNQNQQAENEQQLALPVSGNVTESFQANGSGIMIAPKDTSDIMALDEGVVIFAGNDPETDKTVVVQHADGSLSSYGFLSEIDVHLYQFVSSNEQLGTFVPNKENKTVFFAIEKDNKYVDPVQVIKVDDTP